MSWLRWVEDKAKDAADTVGDAVGGVASTAAPIVMPIIRNAGNPIGIPGAVLQGARAVGNTALGQLPGYRQGAAILNNPISTSAVPNALSPAGVLNALQWGIQNAPQAVGTGSRIARNTPSAVRSVASDMIHNPLETTLRGAEQAFSVIDKPRQAVISDMGDQAYYMATHQGEKPNHGLSADPYVLLGNILPDAFLTRWANDPNNWPAIQSAYENGYGQTPAGGRAVWELYVSTLGHVGRVLADTAFDPLNAIPGVGAFGRGVSRVGQGLEVADDATQGSRALGSVLNLGGGAIAGTAGAIDRAGNLPFEVGGKLIGGAANAIAPELTPRLSGSVGDTVAALRDRFESAVSKQGRAREELANRLGGIEGITDEIPLPEWAQPKPPTGRYEVVEVDRNTGASYIVDRDGNPIPNSATTGKGATAVNKRAVNVYNKEGGAKPVGRPASAFPEATDAPLTTPVTEPLITPEPTVRDFTPEQFFQTPQQRRAGISLGDISIDAPNLRDTRIPSLVERQMAVNPEAATRYYQLMGIDPNTGSAVPDGPAFLHDRAQAALNYDKYPNDFSEGYLYQKMVGVEHTVNDQMDAFRSAFGKPIAASMRDSAKRPLEKIRNELLDDQKDSALADLIDRAVYGRTQSDSKAAIGILMSWAKTHKDYPAASLFERNSDFLKRVRDARETYIGKLRAEATPSPSSQGILDAARNPDEIIAGKDISPAASVDTPEFIREDIPAPSAEREEALDHAIVGIEKFARGRYIAPEDLARFRADQDRLRSLRASIDSGLLPSAPEEEMVRIQALREELDTIEKVLSRERGRHTVTGTSTVSGKNVTGRQSPNSKIYQYSLMKRIRKTELAEIEHRLGISAIPTSDRVNSRLIPNPDYVTPVLPPTPDYVTPVAAPTPPLPPPVFTPRVNVYAKPESSQAALARARRSLQIDDETLDYLSKPQGDLDVPVIDAYYDLVREGKTHTEAVNELMGSLFAKTDTAKREARDAINKAHPTRAKMRAVFGKIETLTKMARENTMYNVANALPGNFGDRLGNRMMLFQEGKYAALARSFDPRGYWQALSGPTAVNDYFSKESHDLLAGFGKDLPAHVRGSAENKFGDSGKLILTKATEDAPWLVRKGSGIIASQRNADVRHAMEVVERAGLTTTELAERLPDNILAFKRELQAAGLPADATVEAIQKRATDMRAPSSFTKDAPNRRLTSFSPEDVLAVTNNKKLADLWQRQVNGMYREAGQEATRVFFAGARRYGIDDALGRAVFFHFWASRAIAQQAKAMARSPRVFGAYYRMIQGAMHEADEKGYPATFRGLMHYWGDTDSGFYALFNPLGVIVPAMMFSDLATMGGSESGSSFQKWAGRASSILPIAPWLNGAIAALGITDQTPNFTGTARIEGLVQDVINYANANTSLDFKGGGLVDNPVTYWTQRILKNLNERIGQTVTGQKYEPYNPTMGKIDNVNSVLTYNLTQEMGPTEQWTPEQWDRYQQGLEAITFGGAENPDAERALSEYTSAALLNRGAGMLLPQGSVLRYGPRQNMINAKNAGGQEAQDIRSIVTASPTTQPILIGQQELDTLGTDQQKNLYKDWNNIVYGVDSVDPSQYGQYVQIGDQRLTVGQIRGLSEDQRIQVADAFVQSVGGTAALKDYKAQRTTMIDGNPALATFQEYKSQVGKFAGGVRAFRKWASTVSPQYKQAEQDQRDYFQKQYKISGDALESELDDWAFRVNAYAAFAGQADSIYDQSPLPGASAQNDPNQAFPGGSGSNSGGSSSGGSSVADRITRALSNYQQDLAIYQAQGGSGQGLPGAWSQWSDQQYGQAPTMSADLERYLRFAQAAEANGQDSSPQAYEVWTQQVTSGSF